MDPGTEGVPAQDAMIMWGETPVVKEAGYSQRMPHDKAIRRDPQEEIPEIAENLLQRGTILRR
jgi:hypothetical protein